MLLVTQPPHCHRRSVVAAGTGACNGALGELEKLLTKRYTRRTQLARNVSVLEPAPHAIRARQQHVFRLDGATTGQGHVGQNRVSSEATFDEVAHRMSLRLVGGDETL